MCSSHSGYFPPTFRRNYLGYCLLYYPLMLRYLLVYLSLIVMMTPPPIAIIHQETGSISFGKTEACWFRYYNSLLSGCLRLANNYNANSESIIITLCVITIDFAIHSHIACIKKERAFEPYHQHKSMLSWIRLPNSVKAQISFSKCIGNNDTAKPRKRMNAIFTVDWTTLKFFDLPGSWWYRCFLCARAKFLKLLRVSWNKIFNWYCSS